MAISAPAAERGNRSPYQGSQDVRDHQPACPGFRSAPPQTGHPLVVQLFAESYVCQGTERIFSAAATCKNGRENKPL